MRIVLLLVLPCLIVADSMADPIWLHLDDADSTTETVAPFIYDPLSGRSHPNTGSLPKSAAEIQHEVDSNLADGFTIEGFVKLESDPERDAIPFAFGDHAVGAHRLPRWNQTYWSGFSSQTQPTAWQTGHYVTISRIFQDQRRNTLRWRHIALVYDARRQQLTAWLDHWQSKTQRPSQPLEPGSTIRIGGDFPGLIDEVRFTPRPLRPHEFLRAVENELEGIEFDHPDTKFPRDAGHLDIRRHFGAIGDGVHDDTAAFQRAMRDVEDHTIVFIPNGTYLVSDTIYWRQWKLMVGEDERNTIIRLKDGCEGFGGPSNPKPVIRTHFNNNQSFENTITDLTVDTGHDNPGAIGIRYNAHNTGEINRVTIRSGDGRGVMGLDMTETEFGPAMVRNLTVDGFDVGISTVANVSHVTMENITVRDQNVVGLRNHLPMSLRNFYSDNRVTAIENAGWLAQLTMLDSRLEGNDTGDPAITMRKFGSGDFRRVKVSGYDSLIESDDPERSRPEVPDGIVNTLVGTSFTLFNSNDEPVDLPIEDAPAIFEEPIERWVTPDFSSDDDTAAVQAALDSGAATIHLKNREKYRVSDTLRVPPSVRRIVGMKGVLIADPNDFAEDQPMIRIEGGDASTPPVHIDHLRTSFHPGHRYGFEIDTPRDVVIRYSSAWLKNTSRATGKLFIEEQMGWVHLFHPQRAWIRQLDTEGHRGTEEDHETYLINRGGEVWVFGMKTESLGVHAETTDGGKTEILGGFFRDHKGSRGVPYFRTIDSDLSANWVQYAWRPGAARSLQAVETQAGQTETLERKPTNGVIGRYRAQSGS